MSGSGWFEPSRPIRVEGGIRVRSKRGSIGERWWSRRFIDILESVCDPGRLGRGRSYARSGQVLDLELGPGLVTARVQGSRRTPYLVEIQITPYAADQWRELADALAAQALYRAKLLAGEMPPEIEEVFRACRLPLFPGRRGLDMNCSCPDWGFPCKHLSAVLYVLAERFDDDPFLVLAWRGIARDALLDALREAGVTTTGAAAGSGSGSGSGEHGPGLFDVDDAPFTDRLAAFYEPSVSPARLRDRTGLPVPPPDLLLRTLDPPQIKARHIPILDLLRPAYRTFADDT
ncbi:SWIM zinc finger family protein [Streptosporangium sp. NBC_01810]|uniref:SWIM zinc finger family protein n=1 Tax=Streptosporangium sp. NBC_01810 TaxID=2975951 RepID=UPI002DDA8B61|nr:SWIM zinc finger family protein [Streptosporangium sp. NBC_01810]WSA27611.1 SWIM zinc finger family protein [Streptosporangium sp. NBC_01810]